MTFFWIVALLAASSSTVVFQDSLALTTTSLQQHRRLGPTNTILLPTRSTTSTTRLFNLLDDIFGDDPQPQRNNNNANADPQAEINSIQNTLFDQSDVLIGLEVARDELKSVLEKKQAELEATQDVWGQEKTSLVAQLAALTADLTQSKSEAKEGDSFDQEQMGDYQSEQERLQREIQLLQNQQSQVDQRLTVEREKNEALQVKLAKANDSLEFAQMLFFKDKKELQAKLEQQQAQLSEMQKNLNVGQDQFGQEQTSLQAQLQAEKEKLAASQTEIQQLQRDYYQDQDLRKQELRQEERTAREAQRALEQQRSDNEQEQKQLQRNIQRESTKLADMEASMEQEAADFDILQPKLEQTFQDERLKVEQLSRQLQTEQDRFDREKMSLELRIAAETNRLTVVQTQLSRERTENRQVMEDLDYERTLIQDQRAEDRARMGQRYAALREAITARIENEKRQGRSDLTDLKQKYLGTLADTQGAIEQLQDQVTLTVQSRDNMQEMVDEVKVQIGNVYKYKQESEGRYQRLIMDRKIEIKSLETDLEDLKQEEIQRGKEIERVEHSYREIAKASLKLTGRRLNRLNPLRLVRRRKDKSSR